MGVFCRPRRLFWLGFWLGMAAALAPPPSAAADESGSYPMVEISFRLPAVSSDFFAVEAWVLISTPQGKTVRLPAFYDGLDVWRARFTPTQAGRHSVRVTQGPAVLEMAAGAEDLTPQEFEVTGSPGSGFVRRDPKGAQRFVLDDGTLYFPIGHNVAWSRSKTIDIIPIFDKMGAAKENWARVWMCHWDGKNLDWVQNKKNQPGTLNLEVARKWDEIVRCAEKNGLRLQIVFQHHGQYSTSVNPNWKDNPWNVRRGGFLAKPNDFFTDPKAIELSKQKYRYIVARWGYSTSIMAWELFNEVEYTDAYEQKQAAEVLKWHADMAAYLRSIDPWRHLITTSSLPTDHPIWKSMDYFQPHIYPADLIAASAGFDTDPSLLPKPVFYGEIGPKADLRGDDGRQLKRILWPSLLAGGAGAAQYWPWDTVERNDLYSFFQAAAAFVQASGLPTRELASAAPTVESIARSDLKFGPGGIWGKSKQTEFTIPSDGRPIEGLGGLSPYLHGDPKKIAEGYPRAATFRIDARQPTTFTVRIGTVAKAGAALSVLVDGGTVASKEWEPAQKDFDANAEFRTEIPAGRHTITVRSLGKDWFYVKSFALSDFAPMLGALGRSSPDFAALWIYHRQGLDRPGTPAVEDALVKIPGPRPGTYRVVWWDTMRGAALKEETVHSPGGPLTLSIPPVATDVAAFAELVDTR